MAIASQPTSSPVSAEAAADGGERWHLRDGSTVILRSAWLEDDGDERVRLTAEVEGHHAGRATFQRVYGRRAAVCVDVDAAWMDRGLPALLLYALGAAAARRGIETFLMRVRTSDVRLVALLHDEFGAHGAANGDYIDLELPVPERSAG
jgi:GNAT superfamily N-acetyltransferase